MLRSEQIRAARALLGWRQEDLALRAKVGIVTVRRLEAEDGPVMGNVSTVLRIQEAFEREGIRFIEDAATGAIGVSLEKKKKR